MRQLNIATLWFIVAVGILKKVFENRIFQEVASVIKLVEFATIPAIHILTSPAIQKNRFWKDLFTN